MSELTHCSPSLCTMCDAWPSATPTVVSEIVCCRPIVRMCSTIYHVEGLSVVWLYAYQASICDTSLSNQAWCRDRSELPLT